jgi:hypothetical protein
MTGYQSKRAAAQDKLAQLAQAEQCSYPDCKCPTENPCLKSLAQPAQEPTLQKQLDIARADWRQAHVDYEIARAEVVRVEKLMEQQNG